MSAPPQQYPQPQYPQPNYPQPNNPPPPYSGQSYSNPAPTANVGVASKSFSFHSVFLYHFSRFCCFSTLVLHTFYGKFVGSLSNILLSSSFLVAVLPFLVFVQGKLKMCRSESGLARKTSPDTTFWYLASVSTTLPSIFHRLSSSPPCISPTPAVARLSLCASKCELEITRNAQRECVVV